MNQDAHNLKVLSERVAALERQNRLFKRVGLAAIITASAIVLLAQASPRRHTITASEFIVADSAGRTIAKLDANFLAFYDSGKMPTASIGHLPEIGGVFSLLNNKSGDAILAMGSEIGFKDKSGKRVSYLNENGLALGDVGANGRPRIMLRGDQKVGIITVTDEDGFQSTIGGRSMKMIATGNVESTSAASITMFDKDQRLIWQAP